MSALGHELRLKDIKEGDYISYSHWVSEVEIKILAEVLAVSNAELLAEDSETFTTFVINQDEINEWNLVSRNAK